MRARTEVRGVGVIVPAHNEQDTISNCLNALHDARRHLHRTMDDAPPVRILVVLDACTDLTGTLVSADPHVESLNVHARSVGAARAAGTDALLRTWPESRSGFWLANTDADTTVPLNWLSTMVRAAHDGIHLVLGTAVPNNPSPRLGAAWHALHHLHDGHPYVHGANFGIRADTYVDLGGWSCDTSGEDTDMARRAGTAPGLRTLRTGAIPVLTSSRTTGRAPSGFAHYLHGLQHTLDLRAAT